MLKVFRVFATLLFGILAPPLQAQETAARATTQYVEVAGDRIAYRSIGVGTPMILLTRMRGTLDTWDPLFLDELAKSNRVITVDYPGVGYSAGTLPPDIGRVANFVAAFADAMAARQVRARRVVVGRYRRADLSRRTSGARHARGTHRHGAAGQEPRSRSSRPSSTARSNR